MKYTAYFALLLFSYVLIPQASAQCGGAPFSLDTYYATNNGQRGCMFNITATQEVTIMCFDANLYNGTTADYEIYYRTGTYVGNESNAGAWTLIGTTTALTSNGSNVATNIPIPVMVTIPAGQTYGFYVTNTFGGGTSYTDGTGALTLLGSDANISVNGGVGKSYPFGLTFNYRDFNGTEHYSLGSPLGVELSALDATAEGRNVTLTWETSSEENNDFFTLERSFDGANWETVATIEGQGTTDAATSYSFVDMSVSENVVYYRLSQTDFDGTVSDYSVRAVKFEMEQNATGLPIGPNPAIDFTHIAISPDEMGEVTMSNLAGQSVPVAYQFSEGGITLDVRDLDPGMYVVKVKDNSALLQIIE